MKKCPFCGSKAKILEPDYGAVFVRCENRDCKGQVGYFSTEKKAVLAWNKRARRPKEMG